MAGQHLETAFLRLADLTGADLRGTDLRGSSLKGAQLRRANLSHANLSGCDLSDLDLTGVNLSGADLTGVNLSRADLTGANLTRARLTDVQWTGAICVNATFEHADLWPSVITPQNSITSWQVLPGAVEDTDPFAKVMGVGCAAPAGALGENALPHLRGMQNLLADADHTLWFTLGNRIGCLRPVLDCTGVTFQNTTWTDGTVHHDHPVAGVAASAGAAAASAKPSSAAPANPQRARILLVEADADLRGRLTQGLASQGYRVLAVSSPDQAEELPAAELKAMELLVAGGTRFGADADGLAQHLFPDRMTPAVSLVRPQSSAAAAAEDHRPLSVEELLEQVRRLLAP